MAKFYMRSGWVPSPAPAIMLPARLRGDWTDANNHMEHYRWLTSEDVNELCERDVDDMTMDMKRRAVPPKHAILTILPTSELIIWQHARAEFIAQKLYSKSPSNKGVRHRSDAWMFWHHDFRKQRLFIQRIRILVEGNENQQEILAELLIYAMHEARVWRLPKVVIWEPEFDLAKAIEVLEGSIDGFVPVFEARRRETISVRWREGHAKEIMIIPNEHYAWN